MIFYFGILDIFRGLHHLPVFLTYILYFISHRSYHTECVAV